MLILHYSMSDYALSQGLKAKLNYNGSYYSNVNCQTQFRSDE